MSEKIELDLDAIEAAAKAATPQDFDSAQVASSEDGWIECQTCGGEGSVELTADYLNYDGQALGVQFYGIGEPHVHAEAHYRAARPAVVLAMVEEIRSLRQQVEHQMNTSRTSRWRGANTRKMTWSVLLSGASAEPAGRRHRAGCL
ncbi:hypothetical protein [Pseudomonas putida]|uniref:hypothetical protein n=1 Tax=Pseudomonas putida TaxID=303 RepID=UPI0039062745